MAVDPLADLDDQQRAAVADPADALVVIAGPGSGKTRVLTHRVAHLAATGRIEPARSAVLTFTRRAATEVRARLHHMGMEATPWAGTIHGLAWRLLQEHHRDAGTRPPTIVSDVSRLARIAWERSGGEGPVPERPPAALVEALAVEKRRRGVLDFDDVLRQVADLLVDDARWADAMRWRFRALFIDEAQDLTASQLAFVEALRGDRPHVFAVGDPNQAIYGWNGALPDALDVLRRAAAAQVCHLHANHRSHPAIGAAAHRLLEGGEHHPMVDPRRVERLGFADHDDELAGLVDVVRRHGTRRSWGDVAVLVRTGARADEITAALGATGVPVRRLAERHDRSSAPAAGVSVGTLHAAKGLEWPVVVIASLTARWMPLGRTPDEIAEERRLLYVGATRAEDHLVLTHHQVDDRGPVSACRWLDELDLPVSQPPIGGSGSSPRSEVPPVDGADWRQALRTARRRDDAARGADGEAEAERDRAARLRSWRAAAARAARVDPTAVLPDDVLSGIARIGPTCVDDLAGAGLGPVHRARLGPSLLAALEG